MPAKSRDPLCAPGQDVAILFARAPVPGRVKTRLIGASLPGAAPLTAEAVCALHVACIGDAAALLDRELPQAAKWLFWSEAPGPEFPLAELQLPDSLGITLQSGLDLGERMTRAIERALASQASRVVLIGSDSPTLPAPILREALDALHTHDAALGPSDDGGFYLIACRRFDRALFTGVEWGGPKVFARTAANIAALGFTLHKLPNWYDLDEIPDIARLLREAREGHPLPPRVAAWTKGYAG